MKLTGVRNPGSKIGDILLEMSAGSYWLPLSVFCGCEGVGGDFSGDFLLSLLSEIAVAASGEPLCCCGCGVWGLTDRSVCDWLLESTS